MKRNTILFFLALCLTPSIKAQNLKDILSSIEKNNLTLQALRTDNNADILEMASENQLTGPSIEYSPFYKSGYSGLASSEFIVSETFDFPTRYTARRRQSVYEQSARECEYAVQRRDILLQAELLYFEIIKQNAKRNLLQQRLNNAKSTLQLFEKRMAAGDANALELNKAKLIYMDALTACSSSDTDCMESLKDLQKLNGGIAVDISCTTFPEHQCSDTIYTAPESKDVEKARAALAASEHGVKALKQEWLPSLTIGYRRNTEMRESTNGVIVGVAFPLMGGSKRLEAAKERRKSAELSLHEKELAAEMEHQTMNAEIKKLHLVLDNCDTMMLQQTLGLLTKALQQGEITALQYYAEVEDIYEKLSNHIDIHCRYAQLLAQRDYNNL